MLVAFFGDTHGHLELMFQKAQDWEERTGLELDILFQVGDFGIWPNLDSVDSATARHAEKNGVSALGDFRDYLLGNKQAPKPVFFIRGNHEDQLFLRAHEQIQKAIYPDYLSRSIEICPRFHYVPDGHIVRLGDWRFAAWGGNFAYKTWSSNLEYWDESLFRTNAGRISRRLNHMTRDVYERLIREQFEVLVTHDAPQGSGVVGKYGVDLPPDEMTENGCKPIRELIEVVAPIYQFNGHWHEFHQNSFPTQDKFGRNTKAFVLDRVDPRAPEVQCMEVIEVPGNYP